MTRSRNPKTTVAAHLKRCGVPRREFLQFCTQLMVAAPFGLAITDKANAAEVAREIGQARRPFEFASLEIPSERPARVRHATSQRISGHDPITLLPGAVAGSVVSADKAIWVCRLDKLA